MSDSTKHRESDGLVRRAWRGVVSASVVAALLFSVSASSPFVSDAYAKKKVPKITSGLPIFHWREVMDFNPHFGQKIPPWLATVPVPIPLVISRKVWCGPPIYVFLIGCLPWPRPSWCNEKYKCAMTNVANLINVLAIKHTKPRTDGRNDDFIINASIPDYYNRDACVNSAVLDFDKFDYKTGDIKTDDKKTDTENKYGDKTVGLVAGVKPFLNTCMPTINTPKFEPPLAGSGAYAYYQNAANAPFKSSGKDSDAKLDIYGTSNRYLSTTFPIEGVRGCPKEVFEKDENPLVRDKPTTPAHWKARMEKCYDYFILSRATHPEWTLERPGISTDDPLTQDPPKGNPDLALFSSCQPLMDGNNAKKFLEGASPVDKDNPLGFAPVLQYDRPDLDEADYDTGKELERSYLESFKNGIAGQAIPVFQNIFPCVRKPVKGDVDYAGENKQTYWAEFNSLFLGFYGFSAFVEHTILKKKWNKWGLQTFVFMPEEDAYTSVGGSNAKFCPNVEKINVPTNPFSPRDNMESYKKDDTRSAAQKAVDMAAHYVFLRASGYAYTTLAFFFQDTNMVTDLLVTDREYSYLTSFYGPKDRMANTWEHGYSDYTDNFTNKKFDKEKFLRHQRYPEVMCGVVPVDVIEPRRRAFNNCIMQRINYNFFSWRRWNFLQYYFSDKILKSEWERPCATRFYERDNVKKCPASLSIQQCCRIIVKDVVPMNYVKIRTCEGLRQKRRLIFGYDHIYDAVKSNRSALENAVAEAEEALELAQEKYDDDLAHLEQDPTGAQTGITPAIAKLDLDALNAAIANLDRAKVGAVVDSAAIAKAQAELTAEMAKFDALRDKYSTHKYFNNIMCRVGPDYGRNPNGCDIGNCHGACNAPVASFKPIVDAIRAAEARLKIAQNTFIMTPLINDPIPSPGGKIMEYWDDNMNDTNYGKIKINTVQTAYDEVYKINQKLTLIGCNDTEPDDYRFSHYFPLSKWAEFGDSLPTNLITDGITALQEGSDNLIFLARKEANAGVLAAATPILDGIEAAKTIADNATLVFDKEKAKAIQEAQDANDECNNAKIRASKLLSVKGILTAGPDDLMAYPDVAMKCALAKVYETKALAVAKVVGVKQDVQNDIARGVQDTGRVTIQEFQDAVEANAILKGKAAADELIIEGVAALEKTVRATIPPLIDKIYDATQKSTESKLAVAFLGEGGAHMPYMRWWDTGTSAGNPTRGGSFINTLGSYDTIIGVGHEERDYYDAGGSSTIGAIGDIVNGFKTGNFNAKIGNLINSAKTINLNTPDILGSINKAADGLSSNVATISNVFGNSSDSVIKNIDGLVTKGVDSFNSAMSGSGTIDDKIDALSTSLSLPNFSIDSLLPKLSAPDKSISSGIYNAVIDKMNNFAATAINDLKTQGTALLNGAITKVTSQVASQIPVFNNLITVLKNADNNLSSIVQQISTGAAPISSITAAISSQTAAANALVANATTILGNAAKDITAAKNAVAAAGAAAMPKALADLTAAQTAYDLALGTLDKAKAVQADVTNMGNDLLGAVNNIASAQNAVAEAEKALAAAVTPDDIAAKKSLLDQANIGLTGAKDAANDLAKLSGDAFNTITDSAQADLGKMASPDVIKTSVNKAANTLFDSSASYATGANSPDQSLTQSSRMGRIGGWNGLKGHQMWTTRYSHLSCIGRYEKLFKQGEAENFVLSRAGTNYVSKAGVQWPWPLGWRGYIGDPNNEFEKNIAATGLDNVEKGDIIIYKAAGIKRIAYVGAVNKTEPQFIKIESWDNGKFPTSTGFGIGWGNKIERTIYKTTVPEGDKKRVAAIAAAKIGGNPSCEDPGFTACVLGGSVTYILDGETITENNDTWNTVKIYRPSLDTAERQCPFLTTGGGKNIQSSEKDTDTFTYCINAGFDPPKEYILDYHGSGTGSISDLPLCGPKWTQCTTVVKPDAVKCFPGGDVCTIQTVAPPPPPPPVDDTCTKDQYDAAKAAYDAEIAKKQKAVDDAIAAQDALYEDARKLWDKALIAQVSGQQAQGNNALAWLGVEKAKLEATLKPVPAPVYSSCPESYDCSYTEYTYDLDGNITSSTLIPKTCTRMVPCPPILNQADIDAANAYNAPILAEIGKYVSHITAITSAEATLTADNNAVLDASHQLISFENAHAADVAAYLDLLADTDNDIPASLASTGATYEALQSKYEAAIKKLEGSLAAIDGAVNGAVSLGFVKDAAIDKAIRDAQNAADSSDLKADDYDANVEAAYNDLMAVPTFKCPWP